MFNGKFITSSSVNGNAIRLNNEQYLRSRNSSNDGDINILKVTSNDNVEFSFIPQVESNGRLALFSEVEENQVIINYLLSETNDLQVQIDNLQDDYALTDLSNLIDTSIPDGVNLNSNSSDFIINTANVTSSDNSGNISINSGSTELGDSGNININTGESISGTKGNINLTSNNIIFNSEQTSTVNFLANNMVSSLQIGHTAYGLTSSPYIYCYNVGNEKVFQIGSQGLPDADSGTTEIHSSASISINDGSYNSGILNIYTKTETGQNAPNVQISSGDLNIYTGDGFVSGSGLDTNSGNINLFTGTNTGSGVRGIISLNARHISAESNQIKNVQDPTDSQDAVTLNYLTTNYSPSDNDFISAYDDTTQTNPIANQIRAMQINNTVDSHHISIVNNSEITFQHSGVYNIQFSAQFTQSNSSQAHVYIWFRLNGVDIPNSNSSFTIANQARALPSWNYMERVNDGDNIQIMWLADDTSVQITAIPASVSPAMPAIPSVIVTAEKVAD